MRRLLVTDSFAPQARSLRAHFEQRFADPRVASRDRFVWDFWNVEGQYTALRTPAWEFFPPKLYAAFHQHLVWWGRRTLGCHDVSPPWLSCYVNGCEQRLHGDLPHGPAAFVFSLTPWNTRSFRGGQTLLLQDHVLDYWQNFVSARKSEEDDLLQEVEPRFNRLVTFDPRIPHGVRRVEGPMDPRAGRLVIHGWFVQPRPFIKGPVSRRSVAFALERLGEVVSVRLQEGLNIAGLLSLRLSVTHGEVLQIRLLMDTMRSPASEDRARRKLVRDLVRTARTLRFSRSATPSTVTVPFVFERSVADKAPAKRRQ